MTAARTSRSHSSRGEGRLWISLFAPAAAWITAQQASFLLTPWICATGRRWVLYLITVAAALAAAAATAPAWRSWRDLSSRRETADQARRRFLTVGGLLLGAFFVMAILAFAIPDLVHRPCD